MSGLAAHVMGIPVFSRVYQRAWRPVFTRLFSLGGSGTADFDASLLAYLARPGERIVLDVACGPGNYTAAIAQGLSGSGRVIGVDFARSMLHTAALTNSSPRATYVRADAHALPLPNDAVDSAICLAALYLIPNPLPVIDEMMRVLRPGGQIAIFTSAAGPASAIPGVKTLTALGGYRVFKLDEITGRLRALGAVRIEQTVIGEGQYVLAVKP